MKCVVMIMSVLESPFSLLKYSHLWPYLTTDPISRHTTLPDGARTWVFAHALPLPCWECPAQPLHLSPASSSFWIPIKSSLCSLLKKSVSWWSPLPGLPESSVLHSCLHYSTALLSSSGNMSFPLDCGILEDKDGVTHLFLLGAESGGWHLIVF